jgi:protein gp37
MGDRTGIEWTDATWNPVHGCSKVSPGCANCYAETLSLRRGFTRHPWTGLHKDLNVSLHPERLDQPLRWRRPRRVFVNSMSDLFHEQIPDEFIDRVWAVMALAGTHTFQVLTKRPDRMRAYLAERSRSSKWIEAAAETFGYTLRWQGLSLCPWPLPHVWLGVSVEDQRRADERIPLLLQTPAAVRFISAEPLLGPVDLGFLEPCDHVRRTHAEIGCWKALDWIIVGGESGPGARPMDLAWARSLVAQAKAAGVATFVKQLGSVVRDEHGTWSPPYGARDRKRGDPDEWPDDLRVREMPRHGAGVETEGGRP